MKPRILNMGRSCFKLKNASQDLSPNKQKYRKNFRGKSKARVQALSKDTIKPPPLPLYPTAKQNKLVKVIRANWYQPHMPQVQKKKKMSTLHKSYPCRKKFCLAVLRQKKRFKNNARKQDVKPEIQSRFLIKQ